MNDMHETPVLIAGGGPIGMTLALELAMQGVRSVLVERNPTTTRHPKMDLTNGRSMELFRRLGLAERINEIATPPDNPFNVCYVTSVRGKLLHRFAYPSPNEWRERAWRENEGQHTREAPMRVSQILLEPELKAAIEASSLVETLFGWRFESFSQDENGVTCELRNGTTDERRTIRAGFLAGCDGAGSVVREQLGLIMEGDSGGIYGSQRRYMVHFKSKARDRLAPQGITWHLQWAKGVIIAQDDSDTWTLHVPIPPGVDAKRIDPREIVKGVVGEDFEDFEVQVANGFALNMLVADYYGHGRVWIAGDAAHLVIPTGGYGMNTGVCDSTDLGWKLAATIKGWGGPELLASYEAERRPIAVQNRAASQRHANLRVEIAKLFEAATEQGWLHADGAEAVQRRAELGAQIGALGNLENESWGIEHGYRYRGSSVICAEGNEPPFDPSRCIPTTWPGSRLPHVFLEDGLSIHDHLVPTGFTLLALNGAETPKFAQTASEGPIPLTIVRLVAPIGIFEKPLILVRPDQHVAWRGDMEPGDVAAVLRQAAGWNSSSRGN